MHKAFQAITLICICIMTASVAYYFVVRPMQLDKPLKDCLAAAQFVRDSATSSNPIEAFATSESLKADCFKQYR
jgi:hypothetical protein